MSTLKTGTVWADTHKSADGSLEFFKCRAWVNFNGTGTVAIRASGNVSSITDNGEGDYTVNFTNAMPDANYAPSSNSGYVGDWQVNARPLSESACRIISRNGSNEAVDIDVISASFFR